MKSPSISVVIPNYNGALLLKENLPALVGALEKAGHLYEIIISDDRSTDASLAFIRQAYPGIRVVEGEGERGFSSNMNRGIRAGRYDLVLLLNSDIRLEEDYFLPLFGCFEKENTFGVMGCIYDKEDGRVIDSIKLPKKKLLKYKGRCDYLPGNIDELEYTPTFFLSGANALVDRRKLVELEGFDELFAPFYSEDVDLSWRAWRLGWECYYCHAAKCAHAESSTIGSAVSRGFKKRITIRNKLILHSIHYSFPWRLLFNMYSFIELLGYHLLFHKPGAGAYREYFSVATQREITRSRERFAQLIRRHNRHISIFAVEKMVRSGLKKLKAL